MHEPSLVVTNDPMLAELEGKENSDTYHGLFSKLANLFNGAWRAALELETVNLASERKSISLPS